MRARQLILLALAVLGIAAFAADWIALACQALTYPTTAPGAAANLAVLDSLVYATRAEAGVEILDSRTGRSLGIMAPAAGSADDVAAADGLLFVLDARAPGHLAQYDLSDPARPRLIGAPVSVPVGPFSGISAAHGTAIVSGGTSKLTVWRYDRGGLTGPADSADFGRGQPDVLVSRYRPLAWISTHYRGPAFGLDVAGLGPGTIRHLASLPLERAGFTTGGARPASFPIESAELSADTVLVAHRGGLAIVYAADPRTPRLLDLVELGGPAVNVDALGQVAAVSVAGRRPAIVLVALAPAPRIVRRIILPPGTHPGSVALTPERIMVAAADRGILFFDRERH